jgi:serine protease AprX
LGDRFLVEDITDQYAIRLGGVGGETIDTSVPRVTRRGATLPHPSYRRTRRLAPGSHHYLVQFVGPIKPEWQRAVEEAGGVIADAHSNFTLIVRAPDAQRSAISGIPAVRWIGHLPDRARIDVIEDERKLPRTQYLPNMFAVESFTVQQARSARSDVRRLCFTLVARGALR